MESSLVPSTQSDKQSISLGYVPEARFFLHPCSLCSLFNTLLSIPHVYPSPVALTNPFNMSTNPPNFHTITTVEQFQEVMKNGLERISLVNFWASWAEPCKPMNELVLELANKYPDIQVLHVRPLAIAHLMTAKTYLIRFCS